MKRNPYYRLKYIADIPYLIAFGQATADFKRDLRLNETGAFLWNQLENISTMEELLLSCSKHFKCTPEQSPLLEATVKQFIDTLYGFGILLPADDTTLQDASCKTLEIAGLFCRLYGPDEAFSNEFNAFVTSKEPLADSFIQEIHISTNLPEHTKSGKVLLRNKELTIMEGEDKYLLFFPSSKQVTEAHISIDGSISTLFCTPQFTEDGKTEILYAIRTLFLYFAQKHQMLAIHSASILYQGKIWMFSAPSGTGKSTHAELWKKLLQTPVINGDLNLITLQEGKPVVHGIPWCGTSGIYDTASYPLGGIILLKQAPENRITYISEDLKQLMVLHRCISPSWTDALLEQNLEIIQKLYSKIFICRLSCTKTDEAVNCLKQAIDAYLRKL